MSVSTSAEIPRPSPAVNTWKQLATSLYFRLVDDHLMAIAGGVVFFGLLALFPAITALVSLYGWVADSASVAEDLAALKGLLPQGAYDLIAGQAQRAAAGSKSAFGLASLGSLMVALWSANTGTKSMIEALNMVDDAPEVRSFVRLNLASMLITTTAIVVLIVTFAAVVVVPIVLAVFGVSVPGGLEALRWPLLFALVLAGVSCLYRFGPSRRPPGRLISIGAVSATVLWFASALLVSWYVSDVANYNAIYGSLGAVIGLMLWMWVSTLLVLLGYALDVELRASRGEA